MIEKLFRVNFREKHRKNIPDLALGVHFPSPSLVVDTIVSQDGRVRDDTILEIRIGHFADREKLRLGMEIRDEIAQRLRKIIHP